MRPRIHRVLSSLVRLRSGSRREVGEDEHAAGVGRPVALLENSLSRSKKLQAYLFTVSRPFVSNSLRGQPGGVR
jgi:hypothetical protein